MKMQLSPIALKMLSVLATGLFTILFFMGCNDDPSVVQQKYELNELNTSGVSGTVTFRKVNETTTHVIINLSGTSDGDTHPTHIHNGSAASPGSIAIDLTSVDGDTGRSETMVTQLNDGTPISYEGLLEFSGYVNIHNSVADLGTLLAQGNIGASY